MHRLLARCAILVLTRVALLACTLHLNAYDYLGVEYPYLVGIDAQNDVSVIGNSDTRC